MIEVQEYQLAAEKGISRLSGKNLFRMAESMKSTRLKNGKTSKQTKYNRNMARTA